MKVLTRTLLVAALMTGGIPIAGAQDAPSGADALPPLEQTVVDASSTALQATLYDLQALQHNTHQAHWNVIGSDFYQLHEFYGELYTGLGTYIDDVAERMLAVGTPADGRPGAIAEETIVETIATGELPGTETTAFLTGNYATVSGALYPRLEEVADDMPTQDLLIAVTHFIDKSLWQLRAHTR